MDAPGSEVGGPALGGEQYGEEASVDGGRCRPTSSERNCWQGYPSPAGEGIGPAEPALGREENSAWLEAVLAAADLVCWAKLICFAHVPSLARCEIAAFGYRVLHVAAWLTRSARQAPENRPQLAMGRVKEGG